MASSKNRFALLDKAKDQFGHGIQDTFESFAIPCPQMKRKMASKTSLKLVHLMAIVWNLLSYFFGFAFLRRDTARYYPVFATFSEVKQANMLNNFGENGQVLHSVIISNFPSSAMSERALSTHDSPTTPKTPSSRFEPWPRKSSSGPPPAYTPQRIRSGVEQAKTT